MREIKFRAWLDGEMYPDVSTWTDDYTEMLNETLKHFQERDHEKMILMQYTGLKDKNGKEIYEGDVVRIPAFLPELNIVRFDRGAFCLQPVLHEGLDSNFWSDIKYAEDDRSEVIGNIWEHPNLLESK